MGARHPLFMSLALVLAGGPARAEEDTSPSESVIEPFPLLEKGIVVGAGFGMHAWSRGYPKLEGVATVGFAYAGVLPGYWSPFSGALTKRYCAQSWSQDAVDYAAAKTTYPWMDAAELKQTIAREKRAPVEQRAKGAIYRKTRWLVGSKGVCWPRMFGLFAALPGDFDVNVRASAFDELISRNVRPVISTGLVIAPKPYIHVLVGTTLSHVVLEEDGKDVRLWSGFFGVGTTIDAVFSAFY